MERVLAVPLLLLLLQEDVDLEDKAKELMPLPPPLPQPRLPLECMEAEDTVVATKVKAVLLLLHLPVEQDVVQAVKEETLELLLPLWLLLLQPLLDEVVTEAEVERVLEVPQLPLLLEQDVELEDKAKELLPLPPPLLRPRLPLEAMEDAD